MAQPTFNQINRSPTVYEQEDMDDLEVQPVQKGKRGRKRHSDEESLTEAEKLKKEKNRKAAQKCREKKEKEAKDLKIRNEELERENKKLSDEKKKLEMRAEEFHKIIQIHIQKGCSLPPNVQEVYNEGRLNKSSSGCSEEVELYRAVGTIERDHTPPHTPEESCSGNVSPHVHTQPRNFTGAPTALFSGTPLTDDEVTRRRSSSMSRSPSSSPALPLSPGKSVHHLPGQQKDLSYFLAHNQVPRALAPISATHLEKDECVIPWLSSRPQPSVPTVVTDIEEDCEDSTEYISKSYQIVDKVKSTYTRASLGGGIEASFQLPDVPSEDEIAKQLARQGQTTHREGDKQNLPSLGFSCISGYSYTEDLQKMESVEEIIDYTNDVHPDNSQIVSNRKQNPSLPHADNSDSKPIVNVSACAPALLGLCEEMSPSLQQQIKTSYISPANIFLGNFSVPESTQLNLNKSQQYALTQSGLALTPSGLVSQPVGTNTQQSAKHYQLKSEDYLKFFKERNLVTTASDGQHFEVSSEQIQEILKSLLICKNVAGQNQNSDQPKEVSNQEELLVQHGSADLMSAGLATSIVPICVSVPVVNTASTRVQTFNPSSSQVVDLPGFSKSSASAEATQPPVATKHRYVVKDNTRIILVNGPLTEVSSAQAQTLIVSPASSTFVLETTDYSENLQDLPSLNLAELNTDSNLFEKRPSRLT